MSKKSVFTACSSAAALLALGIGTGFIHKENAKTPEQCLSDVIDNAKKLPPQMAASFGSASNAVDAPEVLQIQRQYASCVANYDESKNGITLAIG